MPQPATARVMTVPPKKKTRVADPRTSDAIAIARESGLLGGTKTLTVRGRMPSGLVVAAKKKTGIQSDSKLIEAALASLVVADDYADWLLSQRGTVSQDIDLGF